MAKYYTPKKNITNKKYDDKTYKKMVIRLRLVEDAELIDAIQKAKDDGITFREWLWSLYKK